MACPRWEGGRLAGGGGSIILLLALVEVVGAGVLRNTGQVGQLALRASCSGPSLAGPEWVVAETLTVT